MKTFKQFTAETLERRNSEDENNFIDKHVIDKKEHPVAKEDQFVAKNVKKDKTKKASYHDDESKEVYEEIEPAAKHEMHWADHTKKAKEARLEGDRDHALAHQQAADAHDRAGRSHEKGSKFAKEHSRKAMAASQKANNFYDKD